MHVPDDRDEGPKPTTTPHPTLSFANHNTNLHNTSSPLPTRCSSSQTITPVRRLRKPPAATLTANPRPTSTEPVNSPPTHSHLTHSDQSDPLLSQLRRLVSKASTFSLRGRRRKTSPSRPSSSTVRVHRAVKDKERARENTLFDGEEAARSIVKSICRPDTVPPEQFLINLPIAPKHRQARSIVQHPFYKHQHLLSSSSFISTTQATTTPTATQIESQEENCLRQDSPSPRLQAVHQDSTFFAEDRS